jgi:Ni/Fe-hydrogenase subunit HybB-like protein
VIVTGVEGFIYPNEVELQWSVLIVLYPFITGLVAGAFILASLERVFNVSTVKPTYRLALLTALAFLIVAPLPLQMHLGHPERSFEMYITPHTESAMAMFGFVYLWYLMGVLVLVRLPQGPGAHMAVQHRPEAPVLRRADALVKRHQSRGAPNR